MNTGTQDETARSARARFEHAVDALPAATANRLRLARRAAIAGSPARRPRAAWALALGTTAALLLGVGWWRQDAAAPAALASGPQASTSQGTTAPPPLDLQAEDDADLYAWLADTPVASDADGGAL